MTVASLFAGIGGFDLALERKGHTVIYANEWDKYAADIYDRHFETKIDRRDITTVSASDLPDFDLLVGGFPCQAFSVAGQRGGFEDTRGTLFFDIARIIEAKQPQVVLLENVKGLLSHDSGRTFATILSTLDELGYDAEWCAINSYYFNASSRPRVFILAMHRDKAPGFLQGTEQATPLYACLSQGVRDTDGTGAEGLRSAERIIRTFAELPTWLDSWDSFYRQKEMFR